MSSLSNIDNDRVLVQEGWGSRTLVHATANGRVIQAETLYGNPVEIDATTSRVLVRRLNVPATTAIIAASTLALAATVTALAVFVAVSAQPVFDGPPR